MSLDKKGQIGATLTWVVAFLVIFFIMLLFVIGAGALSTRKTLSDIVVEKYTDKSPRKLEVQRRMITFLNIPMDPNKLGLEGNVTAIKYLIMKKLGGITEWNAPIIVEQFPNEKLFIREFIKYRPEVALAYYSVGTEGLSREQIEMNFVDRDETFILIHFGAGPIATRVLEIIYYAGGPFKL